jgi:hypothetical protein
MKDANDKKTIDFLETPKKRGRPVTGKAMTAAQRKAEQRIRDRKRVIETDLVRDWTKKDCLVVLNDPRMTIDMQRMAVRQLDVLLNSDSHVN